MRATLAVILARGLGSRLRQDDGGALDAAQQEAATRGAKGLMPVGGRPFLDYVLHEFAEAGVTDVVIVVAPEEEQLRAHFDDEAPATRLRIRYAVQDEPRGTADALLSARDVVCAALGAARDDAGVRHFLMANADDLYPAEAVRALVELDGPGLVAFDAEALAADGLIEPARIQRFALLDVEDGELRDIVEKPAAGHPMLERKERWVSMNLWRFTDAIFEDCAAVRPSPRGELELVDAVRAQLARGVRYRALPQRVAVPDLTHRRDVATLERLLAGRSVRY